MKEKLTNTSLNTSNKMIYVTQGHEKGIGIEVFLKSISLLSQESLNNVTLIANKTTLEENLKLLKLSYQLDNDSITIHKKYLPCSFLSNSSIPQSTAAFLEALEMVENQPNSILINLPTSKDQLILNGNAVPGHTEFLRLYFKVNSLPMIFKAPQTNLILVTDHIPLNQVSTNISSELIEAKLKFTLKEHSKYFYEFEEVLISGINPHCGEEGLLGHEDEAIVTAISCLKRDFPHINFLGPIPADSLPYAVNSHKKQLLVFMYHDQGLTWFKGSYGLWGINMTFGLPFLRMTVDHGTAFDLYGQNKSNYLGCYYMLKTALTL